MENLYILFSRTDSRIGRLIRFVTGAGYNHVSVASREDLSDLVSFARRYYSAPLYGGFVEEGMERYCRNGAYADVVLCRIPLEPQQAQRIEARITAMKREPHHYIYDLAAAAAAPFGYYRKRQDAYTCLHFASELLGLRDVHSIPQLMALLKEYECYRGSIDAFSLHSDPVYFQKIGFWRGISLTWAQCKELFRRPTQ